MLSLVCRQTSATSVIFINQIEVYMEKKIEALIEKKYNVNCIATDIKSDMNSYGDSIDSFDDYWREIELTFNTRSCETWEVTTLKTLVKNILQ